MITSLLNYVENLYERTSAEEHATVIQILIESGPIFSKKGLNMADSVLRLINIILQKHTNGSQNMRKFS